MSLITSCPACGTMFRVVPDQLKISEGWVRCGHCDEVFDASAHLIDEAALAAQRDPDATRPAEMETVPADLALRSADLPTRQVDLPTRPADLPAGRDAAAMPSRPAELPSRSGSGSSSFGPDSEALEPSPLDSPFVFRRSDLADASDPSLPPAPRESRYPENEHEEPTAAELESVSFVRQARRRAFWRRPMVRILLAFASLALAALLVLQLAYQDRDRLALAEPALRPVLERLCELLRCKLGPPRQIDSIVIDSSGFNRLRNDTYRLAFTLRNTARVPVATPAIELTVTDAQDQPIARRVLTPAELGAPGGVIPAAGEWSRSFGLALDVPPSVRVAGYRLLAFYP